MKTTLRPTPPPRVSIIIPVFNKCELTVQCFKAIAETSAHIPHEVIVVDNASSDDTPQLMLNQPPHIRYLRNEVNRNFAGACNQSKISRLRFASTSKARWPDLTLSKNSRYFSTSRLANCAAKWR